MRAQSPRHWVAVNVVEFLAELAMVAHIEIVVSLLPKVITAVADQPAGDSLLQGLQCGGKGVAFGFAQQQMHVLRHDYVSIDAELVTAANTFEGLLESVLGMRSDEESFASVTREGNEMGLSGVVVTLE